MATADLFADVQPYRTMVGRLPGEEAGLPDPIVQWIVKQVSKAEAGINKWREEARQAERFDAGKQYTEEDERILKSNQRPANAFNTVQKYIRYVEGVERDSLISLLFNAISLENTQAQMFGDRVTQLYEWACRLAGADDARSRAFRDFLVVGMGWTEIFISRAKDPRGLIAYNRLPPLEMLWADTDKVNLDGTRWRARESFMDKEEALSLFDSPRAKYLIDTSSMDGQGAGFNWPAVDVVRYKIPFIHTYPLDTMGVKATKQDKCKILQFQWWENKAGYLFEDPLDKSEQWMDEDSFREYDKRIGDLFDMKIDNFDRQIGRKYKRAFVLNRLHLLEDPEDIPGNRFTFNAMCCHWDEFARLWYGFMRVLIDPQRYLNRFINQLLEINSKSAKSGAVIERDAFEDKAQQMEFVDTYARPGSVNIVAPGTLQANKYQEKGLPQVAQGTAMIIDFCIKSMDNVTGISADSLGLGASTEAGAMMKRRQRAGMVLLSSEFDAETAFRKEEGALFFEHLKLIADSRLIRVGGMYDGEVIPISSAPFDLEYDIWLDEVERDPNMRQWLSDLIMGPFGQTMMRMNKFLPDFLDPLPIPRKWIEKVKQMMKQQDQQMQEMRQQGLPMPGGRGQQKGITQIQAEVDQKKAQAALALAKAKQLTAKSGQDDLRLLLDALIQGQQTQQQGQQVQQQGQQGLVDQAGQFTDMMRPPSMQNGGGQKGGMGGGGQPPPF